MLNTPEWSQTRERSSPCGTVESDRLKHNMAITLEQVQVQAVIGDDDLERGAPKLTSLWKWTTDLRGLQRENDRKRHPMRSHRSAKAKGKEIDWAPSQNHVKPPCTDISGRTDTGMATNAPIQPSCTEALPSPSPHKTGAATTRVTPVIPVQVPVSKLERVRTLKFRSRQKLNAREITLSRAELNKLQAFSTFVGTANQLTLFGRQLPPCHRYAVKVELDGSPPQTYICIDGLTCEADIRDFYAVMSQQKYRKYYEPWKLCFKMVQISYTSGEEKTDLDLGHDELTLCGTLLTVAHLGNTRVSTIGGLLEVNGYMMALTTSFGPRTMVSGLRQGGRNDGAVSSTATTLHDVDFPEDVEEALVLEGETTTIAPAIHSMKISGGDEEPTSTSQLDIAAPITPIRGAVGHRADCRLVPVKPQYELPNMVWLDDLAGQDQQPSRHYITEVCQDPSLASVKVRAGASGIHSGIMSLGPSFVDGDEEPLEVWTLHLDDGTGTTKLPHQLDAITSLVR